jgi:tRNA threonylcarbamoyladenosine biosynthesis protein TsaB
VSEAGTGATPAIVAIETATETVAVAVRTPGGVQAELALTGRRRHVETLTPALEHLLAQVDLVPADLGVVAVDLGPGLFTGLRVGVAAARAIALATGKPAIGLTTLAALAAPFFEDEAGALMSVIDARHERVYMQLFGRGGRSLVAPRIATVHIAVHAALAGPIRIVGNAVRQIEEVWPGSEPKPPVVDARAPDIAWVAKLGAASLDLTSPVRPLYLSEADAHPQEAGILPRR